jgi:hypothetical protein
MVIYGCETWSLTLREEYRLRVFEKRVLRRIFGPRRGEVMGDWRKLHNEKLHNLYSSSGIIRIIKSRRMRWEGLEARMAAKRNAYRILVGKAEGKRSLGRTRHRSSLPVISCGGAKGCHEAFPATSVCCQPLHLYPCLSFSPCLFHY